MASSREKMRAARALTDSGFKVAEIVELLGASESTVYEWLQKLPAADAPSIAAALNAQIQAREDEGLDQHLSAMARSIASKLDRMLAPTASATEAMSLPGVMKEYRAIVDDLVGPSKDDEEWLIQVFAKVGHSPHAEA